MNDPKGALAVWNALAGKVRQLIRDQTKSAVRKKKMNIASIDNATQTVTLYEASDPTKTITVPYRAGQGIEALSAGQSVIVEWIYDDLSTAVAATPGQGWSTVQSARIHLGIRTGSATVSFTSGTATLTHNLGWSDYTLLWMFQGRKFIPCDVYSKSANSCEIRCVDYSGSSVVPNPNLTDIPIAWIAIKNS